MQITALSDDQLMSNLESVCAHGRKLLARLVELLGEVGERRLHAKAAYPSLFELCVRKLGMSEDEACRRITAARLARRFPSILTRLASGDLHLTALTLLRNVLNEDNAEALLDAARGKTKHEVELLVAKIAPRPDAPTRLEPLSEGRYKLELTVSAELQAKLARASDLMRHANPSGDVATVLDRALDLLVAKLEKERFAKTTRRRTSTRASAGTPKRRHVPAATRRAVFERDGEQCSFRGEQGRRCPARTLLEIDHEGPRALGGTEQLTNLRVLCRTHNQLLAEQAFGKDHVRRRSAERRASVGPCQDRPSLDVSAGERVARGLVHLGFAPKDARRAVDVVLERHGGAQGRGPAEGPRRLVGSAETLLREALAVLT